MPIIVPSRCRPPIHPDRITRLWRPDEAHSRVQLQKLYGTSGLPMFNSDGDGEPMYTNTEGSCTTCCSPSVYCTFGGFPQKNCTLAAPVLTCTFSGIESSSGCSATDLSGGPGCINFPAGVFNNTFELNYVSGDSPYCSYQGTIGTINYNTAIGGATTCENEVSVLFTVNVILSDPAGYGSGASVNIEGTPDPVFQIFNASGGDATALCTSGTPLTMYNSITGSICSGCGVSQPSCYYFANGSATLSWPP